MNDPNNMKIICHDCPYWEVCKPPYDCHKTEDEYCFQESKEDVIMRASDFRPMVWYKVLVDGQEHIVRIDGTVFRYAIVDYYDGRIWSYGKLSDCRKWIMERRPGNNA